MKKILAVVLSLLMVFSLMPVVMVSADTITATHVYTMDEGNRVVNGYTKYHWSPGFVDIGGDHGYVYRSETKADACAYFKLPAGWSTAYGKVTKISFELSGATNGYFNKPGFMLATGVDNNYKYSGAVRGIWSNVSWTAGSWTKVEIDVSDKDTFIIDGTEARYMCLGQQKSLGVQNSSDKTKGWFYIDNLTLTYEVEADLPEYDITIDGEVVDTVMETKKFTVPTPAEGYHYTDGVTTYVGGEEITVTAPVALTSVINTYDVTIDGTVAGTIAHGSTFTVPSPATGYNYTDGVTTYVGGEEITVTAPVALTSVVATASYTYTMDEGSRIVSGYTQACTPGDGVFEEVNGDWVFKLPSKGDQQLNFTLPEDWFEKPYYKATSISFSISKTSGAAGNTDFVRFTDGKEYVSISEGYTSMLSKYTVDVDESLYGYRTFKIRLKGGSNFVEAKDYIYIDDVTVNFEYDHNYVAPTTYDVTIDGEVVATVEEGETFTLPALEAGKYYVGYEGVTEIVVTEALNLTTATYTYDITIDGEVKATVAYGETYTLPAAPEGKQYVDGYVAGQEFVVTGALAFFTEDIPFVAPEVAITMVEGAQLRFNEVIGMRYRATVDAAAVAAYEAEGYTVTMGTLISPADIIGSFDALTFEADANNYIDVVTDGYYATSENEIAGSIVNIKETNVGRNYIARSYVKLTKDGETYVSYATENDNTRSIKFLANAVIDNDALPVNTAQVALIEKWAAAADWKK